MSADVVGYTAMMAVDARSTLSNLLLCFRRIEGLVRRFGGRIIDAPGDNMLIEFPDEHGAVLCAMEVQRTLEALRRVTPGPAFHMRIGLHAGETLARYTRLYGDPVNIASRLQQAAEPDGIYCSESVVEHLPDAVQRKVSELGERQYKNVPYAVRTYRALP